MPRKKPRPFPNYVAPDEAPANGDVSMDADGNPIAGPSSAPATGSGGGMITPAIRKQMSLEGVEAYEMPKAVLARVAKAELPENVQIRREALLAISKSATIFISYLSAVADELAKQNNRKTILPVDVVEGLGLMEFPEEIRAELRREVREFRALEEGKKKKAADKVGGAAEGAEAAGGAADQSGAGPGDDDDDDDEEEQEDDNDGMGALDVSRADTTAAAGAGAAGRDASDEQNEYRSMSTDAPVVSRPQDTATTADRGAEGSIGATEADEEMSS